METDKQILSGKASEHLAGMIAKQIILCQSVIAGKLNRLVNSYSPNRLKWLLALFNAVIGAAIIVNLFIDKHSLITQKDKKQHSSTHIGQASDLPNSKPTNSFTLKNDHYGK